jgi:hypothetical protein
MSLFKISDEEYDPFYNRAIWKFTFAWLPHRCHVSNRLIWLMSGYQGTAMWTGPGTPVFETHWLTKEDFLVGIIKGKIC